MRKGSLSFVIALAFLCTLPGQDVPRLEHFQCYPIVNADPEVFTTVGLLDQFNVDGNLEGVRVRSAVRFCNPTRKVHGRFDVGVDDIRQHLAVYYTFPQAGPRRVVAIRNQFGYQKLIVRQPVALAVPTQKLQGGLAPHDFPKGLDHFRCYSATGEAPRGKNAIVGLADQFLTDIHRHKIYEPVAFCNPAFKQDENGQDFPIQNEKAHLTCYAMSRINVSSPVVVSNQFIEGEDQFFELAPADTLCVPTEKLEVALIADLATAEDGRD